nr:hypothetical protein [Tanacetum cinerariifolium]
MVKTMEQYMRKTRTNYGSGVARPKIDNKDQFEPKGQFLKELRENTFSGSDNDYANEHIEKVLEIVDLFHVPNIIVDQLMLRVFPISLIGATSRWLRSELVVVSAKLPILNPNEFDLWKMRIKQYFLMTDYSLWEVILNGDSPTPTRVVDGIVQVVAPTTVEQRLTKKNELKARGTLLMALPDKHQLKFNAHKDAKSLMEAIEKRFAGNNETKKVQKTLLKQQYENFNGSSSESLDQIHDRIQKLISQLEILVNDVSSVSAASTKPSTSIFPNVDNLSDVIYSFFASQSNSPQLDNDDLKQIDVDDLDEMDLKWQMTMLTMRARRFLQRTGKNLGANATTSIGFDISTVKCYNCHRRGHFAKECRSPRDTKNEDTQRRTVLVETSTSNALVSQCDGVGSYDWSFQADEEPTNYALMAFTSSSSSSSDNEVAPCTKACSKAYVTLQSHYDKLTVNLRKSQFDVLSYKTSLESVEARLVVYQQNKNVFEEDIKLLKLDVMLRDNALVELRKKFKKAKKERDELKQTLEKFQTSLKNLIKLLEIQITDKTGLKYDNQVFSSTVFDCDEFSSSETDESVPTSPLHDSETVSNVLNVEPSTTKPTKELSQSNRPFALIIEDWVSDSEDDSEIEHTTQAKKLRKDIPKSRGYKHSWTRKACFVCKSLNYLIKDCDYYEKKMVQKPVRNHAIRVNHQHSVRMTHPHTNRHVVPTAVLTRSRLVSLNAARPVTTAVSQTNVKPQRPAKRVVNKPHSPIRRPINHIPSPKTSNFHQKVTTIKAKQDKGVIDSGCSRHMTRNISYLSDFEEINKGYVAFGRNPKGGKITGKGKIRIGKLDFDDVYFVKELKFNLFSVSQMCDKKNNALSIDTECVVLSSDFKLPDKNHAEAVNIVCYVQNKVLVTKPHNKTSYELLLGKTPSIGFIRPFGYSVTILNTIDLLGKFDGKADEGFLVGYSVNSKAFRVFNSRTRIVQETLHINFLENQPNVAGSTIRKDDEYVQQYVLLPLWSTGSKDPQNTDADVAFDVKENESEVHVSPSRVRNMSDEFEDFSSNSTNKVNAASTVVKPNSPNNTNSFNAAGPFNNAVNIIYSDDEEDVGAEVDFSNLETNKEYGKDGKEQGGLTQINDKDFHTCMFACFLSQEEPKRVHQALKDPSYIEAIQEELLQFKVQKEEGIDYEEVFAPVARIKVIRLFLAYVSFMGFMVYQMDVKCAFLYGTIEKEVYVCQPPGFEDPDYPDKVYKVVKALSRLHQAPRAWYEILANYLLENGFQRGKIDQTLFIKKQKGDIFLVQVYVDDIIFGSTNKELCKAFEKLMKDKFQMSSMAEILRKFGLTYGKSASTPIDTEKPLLKDPDDEDVDVHTYRLISWQCKKQTVVATSSIEAEYVAAASCCAQVLWIQNQLLDYGPIPITRVHKDHPVTQIIGDLTTAPQTNSMERMVKEQGGLNQINDEDFHTCMFACFLSQVEPKRVHQALEDPSWIEAMQEELLQFKMQKDWVPVDLPKGFEDPDNPNKVYKVVKALYGLHHAPKAWYETLANYILENGFQRGKIDQTLFIKKQKGDILLVQTVVATSSTKAEYVAAASCCAQVLWIQNQLLDYGKFANLEQDKIAQALEITKLKKRVKKLEKKRGFKSSGLKRLKKVGTTQRVESSNDTIVDDQEDASKQGGKLMN